MMKTLDELITRLNEIRDVWGGGLEVLIDPEGEGAYPKPEAEMGEDGNGTVWI